MSDVLRTLIVEDNTDDALLVMRQLEQAGYFLDHVRVVETPQAMEHAFDREGWDIVIADCSMPYFSGAHALEIVRQKDPEVAFIIVSGVIGEDTVRKAILAGADDYVSKDHLDQLPRAVERALKKAEKRRGELQVRDDTDAGDSQQL